MACSRHHARMQCRSLLYLVSRTALLWLTSLMDITIFHVHGRYLFPRFSLASRAHGTPCSNLLVSCYVAAHAETQERFSVRSLTQGSDEEDIESVEIRIYILNLPTYQRLIIYFPAILSESMQRTAPLLPRRMALIATNIADGHYQLAHLPS